jgi:thioredoxin 1
MGSHSKGDEMKEITKETWKQDVLDQPLVLVDFWAEWCRPCRAQAPILEQIEQDVALLSVVKVNTDDQVDLALEMKITSIPTLMLFKNGEHVWTLTGAKPRGRLLEEIAPYV